MRRPDTLGELYRLAEPALQLLDALWRRMHWWVAVLAVLYPVSGVTIVRPDEVALVSRWGRLVSPTPAARVHGPGLLLAWPRPLDRVTRVPVKRVFELQVDTLASSGYVPYVAGLDPLTQGYALTGDHNIVHVEMMVRYRIAEPAIWAFAGPRTERLLRAETTAAAVRTLGERGIDAILSGGRTETIEVITRRAQAGLDRAGAGIEIAAVELIRVAPPAALAVEFDAVQSAFIGAETLRKDALAHAEASLLAARAAADASLQAARAESSTTLATARGEAAAFVALAQEHRKSPRAVRERLYRETLSRTLVRAGSIRWVPPPSGPRYHGMRLTLGPPAAADPPGFDEP